MSDAEFLNLTLGQLEKLLLRRRDSIKREFLMAGIVAAAFYNANPFRYKNSRTVSPLEFVPGENPQEQSPKEQYAILAGIVAASRKQ